MTPKVTIFQNIKETDTPFHREVQFILDRIKEGASKKLVKSIRSTKDKTERNELKKTLQHSLVMGFDYYKYNKTTWTHAWASVMPYHYDDGSEFSYHNYVDGQWADYALGFIYGIKHNKNLGYFVEGKYNRYWNRTWYDFKLGMNYVIF